MIKLLSRFKNNQDGQSMVEFALVFIFVLVPVLFGIIQFGFIFGGQIVMTGAAREGARMAVVGEDNEAVHQRINDYISAASFINYEEDSAEISPSIREKHMIGDELAIDINGTVPVIIPFFDFLKDSDGEFSISSNVIMRIEQPGGMASTD